MACYDELCDISQFDSWISNNAIEEIMCIVSKERLRQMHREVLLLLSSIADAEKRLEDMKLEAQKLSCAVLDKIENEK